MSVGSLVPPLFYLVESRITLLDLLGLLRSREAASAGLPGEDFQFLAI